MKTYFAPPERANVEELENDIRLTSVNPLIEGLMYVANGLFAVLNEHRQIVAINNSFMKLMGIEDPEAALGLRPGEYVHCIHACEMPEGCGTTPYCATCGAVVTMMTALDSDRPQEETCAMIVERDNKNVDLYFQVRCCPVRLEGRKFILFFLHDISIQQQRATLESTFFHDYNNLLAGLNGKSELYNQNKTWDEERFGDLMKLIQRMVQEFSIQQALSSSITHTYQPLYDKVSVNSLLDEIEETFREHPLCIAKQLEIQCIDPDTQITTDPHLVNRILANMVTNALEASDLRDTVKLFIEPGGNSVTFCVWNRKAIPPELAYRIFQRNFTTKKQLGHGLGTYSMKFFGEKVLGGLVTFTSSDAEGTTFRFTLMQK